VNNKQAQLLFAEEGAIELLTNRVWQTSRDETMQVDFGRTELEQVPG